MIEVIYTSTFAKQLKQLDKSLLEEVTEKISRFKDEKKRKLLKVHKLHSKLSNCWSFSVNYKTRIVFEYSTKNEVLFHAVGDHDVYKN